MTDAIVLQIHTLVCFCLVEGQQNLLTIEMLYFAVSTSFTLTEEWATLPLATQCWTWWSFPKDLFDCHAHVVPVLVGQGRRSALPWLHSIYTRFLNLSSIISLTDSVFKNCCTITSVGTSFP